MSEMIQDGKGQGFFAEVNKRNQLLTFAISEPEDKHVNRRGKTWTVYYETTPVGAGDYFFYFENTGDETLAITDFRTMCVATETILVETVIGTPVYTADVDLVSSAKNLGSSNQPIATIKKDTDISGLTTSNTLYFQRLDTANQMNKLRTSSNILIPQGGKLALKATTGGNAITMVVSITELD